MKENPQTGSLAPFNFAQIEEEVPEIRKFAYQIDTHSFTPLIDSSDITPSHWVRFAELIKQEYDRYDGFIILHGTDTMAFTASALSFMLCHLAKPVILTGSQLPIGAIRTDGKENLLGAIEIAAAKRNDGTAMVPEVAIFFGHTLIRGNRATKFGAERFDAFRSHNYPHLADAGITIRYHNAFILPSPTSALSMRKRFETNVVSMRLYPGVSSAHISRLLEDDKVRGAILASYGSGNAPANSTLIEALSSAVGRGIIVVNITQCQAGRVEMQTYDAGLQLLEAGVISGNDMTFEASMSKLMLCLGECSSQEEAREMFSDNLAGEQTWDCAYSRKKS